LRAALAELGRLRGRAGLDGRGAASARHGVGLVIVGQGWIDERRCEEISRFGGR
jgi:hypothetical protein